MQDSLEKLAIAATLEGKFSGYEGVNGQAYHYKDLDVYVVLRAGRTEWIVETGYDGCDLTADELLELAAFIKSLPDPS